MAFHPALKELHRDYSVWHYDASFAFAIEIPTDRARRVLPRGIHPIEVKPQVALLTVSAIRLLEGNHRFERPLMQVTAGINVMPDMGLAGQLPKFACYVLNVGVTDMAFPADAYNADRLPFHPRPLEVEIDDAAGRVSARDADGPIFDLANVSTRGTYVRKEDFYQVFASDGDELLHGAMTMEAETFEHQDPGNAGVIHDHPFFRGLGAQTSRADSYLQLLTGRDALGIQHYYRLQAVRP